MHEGITLRMEISTASRVVLEVFDVSGARVARRDEGFRGAGRHEIHFDGRDDTDRALPSGVYLCHVGLGGETRTQKLIIQR